MCKAFEEMILDGEERGEERGEQKMMRLIQCMTADGDLDSIPRIASEPEFYKEMLERYQIVNEATA